MGESSRMEHRELGPGLLESAYEECLCYELSQRGFTVQKEVPLAVQYKAAKLDYGYRMDLVKKPLGLVISFQVPALKDGIRRIVNN